MAKSDAQVIEEFEEVVNMKPKELEDWLGTEESKSGGQGEGESKGHAEGRKIVEIQNKKLRLYWRRRGPHAKSRKLRQASPGPAA